MRISRITKIKRNRVFRDFTWPNDLLAFSQFNVIYGWNGSGKTTISTLFESLQNRRPLSIGEAEFKFSDGNSISDADIPDVLTPSVRVFNRDFVAKTVKAIGESNVEPIYYLGEENIDKQNRVDELRVELEKANGVLSKAIADKQNAANALNGFRIEKAKLIKVALLGSEKHANYDKNRFRNAISQLKDMAPQPTALSDEDKETLRRQKDSHPKSDIAYINELNINLRDLRSRISALLEKSVVSHVLADLRSDSKIATWVQEGLNLHTGDHQSDTCRFCRNEFSAARRTELEGHFNDAFDTFQKEVELLVSEIEGYQDALRGYSPPDSGRFYDQIMQDAISAIEAVHPAVDAVIEIFDAFKKILNSKKTAPFQAYALDTTASKEAEVYSVLQERIKEMNGVISLHNNITANLNEQIKSACRKLEFDYVLEALPKYNQLDAALSDAIKACKLAEDKPIELQKQINVIEKEIIEHRRPAEELTLELRNYLGRDELMFEVKSTGYSLNRGEENAHNLSEGERTAIAFLYFLKSLEDKDFDISKSVVVIDDPVSSLDANALFSAFGYMKDRTKNCYQLFILTHNFMFFRQVKNWFHHIKGQKKRNIKLRPARFYMLSSEFVNGKRNAALAQMDRLLEEFESEYHYLFKQVYNIANNTPENSELSQYYGIPNIGRRLIETFLAYRFPDIGGDLSKRFDRVQYDAAKKNRILRFLHTYSHSGGIAEPEHDPSILSDSKQAMLDLLELIKTVDKDHYEGMMLLLQPLAED